MTPSRVVATSVIGVALAAFGPSPIVGSVLAQASPDTPSERPLDACENGSNDSVRMLEIRSLGRIEEELSLVDGVNLNRDVLIVACRKVIWGKFQPLDPGNKGIHVQVRAWHKPSDAGWREMRLNEPTLVEAVRTNPNLDPARWDMRQVNLVVNGNTVVDPSITIPLRRDAVKPNDLVRIRIRIGPADVLAAADTRTTGPDMSDNEEIIESMFEVGRFGLHIRFSDMALFVQRLGEDRVNRQGTNPVLFDSVNFRPSPGVYYGFNYYHRRHASIRFLEPGFGMHLVLLNWNERVRGAPATELEVTQVTNVQIGVGVTGSMFDGTIVGAIGWNLHVKDQRPYIGVGFSFTGLARKIAQLRQD